MIYLVATIDGDVMNILKGYVFRLYPNEKQEELISPAFTLTSIIGIDLGIKDLIVTSFNDKIENKA